jgi:hypothetical protein
MFDHASLAVVPSPLLFGLGGVLALLILGTIAALVLPAMQPGKWSDLGPRMRSWWVMAVLVTAALLAGWQATAVLFAFISFLALKEYLTLAPTRKEDRLIVLLAYLSVFLNYGLIFADALFDDSYQIYLVFTPVYVFLIAAAAMAWIGRTDGYLATVGIVHWGTVVCVYNIGDIAFFLRVPANEAPAGGAALVFSYLHHAAQRRCAILLGQGVRETQDHAEGLAEQNLGRRDWRLAHDGGRVLLARALLHAALTSACGDHGDRRPDVRLLRRHHDERGEARYWREGHVEAHSWTRRRARPADSLTLPRRSISICSRILRSSVSDAADNPALRADAGRDRWQMLFGLDVIGRRSCRRKARQLSRPTTTLRHTIVLLCLSRPLLAKVAGGGGSLRRASLGSRAM